MSIFGLGSSDSECKIDASIPSWSLAAQTNDDHEMYEEPDYYEVESNNDGENEDDLNQLPLNKMI